KKVRGVKIQMAVDKYGIPLAIDVSPANRHDTKGIVPVLRTGLPHVWGAGRIDDNLWRSSLCGSGASGLDVAAGGNGR
ncbi:MAG: transposase, partial [Rhodopila sp.]